MYLVLVRPAEEGRKGEAGRKEGRKEATVRLADRVRVRASVLCAWDGRLAAMIVNVWQREREARREEAEKGAKELFPSHSLTASLPPSLSLPNPHPPSLTHLLSPFQARWDGRPSGFSQFPPTRISHPSFLPPSHISLLTYVIIASLTPSVSPSARACLPGMDRA